MSLIVPRDVYRSAALAAMASEPMKSALAKMARSIVAALLGGIPRPQGANTYVHLRGTKWLSSTGWKEDV